MSDMIGPHLTDFVPLSLLTRTLVEDEMEQSQNYTTQYQSQQIINHIKKTIRFNEDIAVLYFLQSDPVKQISKSLQSLKIQSSMKWVNPSMIQC
ncbi:unnamed protein product (macronuclear) [Paramecium tetraurelia]|uniref:Uncharacterized protein n=1 Tax=Paramecium tetraurelia TaxID=5888 RepID=A0D4T7_PARTE|nr:uncharacterized protein GSPATT00013501001 [Paramecium tetraurelia]CAK78054.1 unnamed protein product [Paramecium tetraurelia]|eukprot:XP_001445451.1 hypothetical protein (macronuclear) [Paramecium tetraurelia strain d4-2]